MEYKSPEDELNIDVYFKGLAYACLYKAAGRYVDEIAAEEITITFVRERKPVRLLQQLSQKNRCVEQVTPGIYYIREPWFPVQIIVTSQLDKDGHVWLRSLTEHLTKIDAQHLVYQIRGLQYKDEKEFADSVLQVAMSANKETFAKLKEDSSMCEALMELMRPEYEAGMKTATEQGMAQGRQHEIFASVQEGDYSPERGAEKLNISIDEFQKRMLEAGYGN